MAEKITLNSLPNNQERIDYLNMVLEKDSSRLELIDSQRSRNLNHALITYAAAFGGAIKFLPDANPLLIAISLFTLALCFFLADFQVHQYQHGWLGTISKHLKSLESVINNPKEPVTFLTYYREEEKNAYNKLREWLSFNRFIYYVLFLGSFCAGIIAKNGWAIIAPK